MLHTLVEALHEAFMEGRHAQEFWPPATWWQMSPWDSAAKDLVSEADIGAQLVVWVASAQPELALILVNELGIQLKPDVRDPIVASASRLISEQSPVGRAAAYRVLGACDADARSGVAGFPLESLAAISFQWNDIPAGHFLCGDHNERRESRAFRIASYPVTNAQFGAFVADDGYSNERVWTATGWDWRETFGIRRLLQTPYPFSLPNHPVVGISWYEAVAYTHWVNQRYLEAGVPYVVRIPTEFELERAIRGDSGNRFAYGNHVDYALCNGADTGIGSTSAVGMFPRGRSQHGLFDATGNVWEWTVSTVDDEWGGNMESDAGRVTRGGAWSYYGEYLRGAFRYAFAPVTRNTVIGVRLAADP